MDKQNMDKMTLTKRYQLRQEILLKGMEGDPDAKWFFTSDMIYAKPEWIFLSAFILRKESEYKKHRHIFTEYVGYTPQQFRSEVPFKALELTNYTLEMTNLLAYLNVMEDYAGNWEDYEYDDYGDIKKFHDYLRQQIVEIF